MLRRVMSALGVLALCAGAASAQVGTTTDLVVGQVVGPDTLPLRAAHVAVTSLESGITRTVTTDDKGHYSVVFPDGGGRYVVTVQYLGMFPMRTLVERRADEDRLVANVHMAAAAVVLSAIRVRAEQGDTLAGGAGATGATVSRELLDRLGFLNDDATALAMITPGVSLQAGSDTSLANISIGGQAPTQTGHTIDGASSGGASLPREATKNASVMSSEYDISQGRYTGGFIDMQTISGANMLRAGVNSSTPLAPIGSYGTDVFLQRQSGGDVGANVSGPLRKDHLFFAGAFHAGSTNMAGLSAYTVNEGELARLGVAPDSLARFLSILQAHGLAAPSAGESNGQFTNHSGFGRIDFTPNEHHTLTLSANTNAYMSRGVFGGPLSTAHSAGQYLFGGSRMFASLTSHAGAWVNDARVSVATSHSGEESHFPGAGGFVVVPSTATSTVQTPSISTFRFGGFGGGNTMTRESSVEAKDELSRLSSDGGHRVKAGLDVVVTRSTGGVPSNIYGTYAFNSLADLAAGTPASFTRTLATVDRRSGVIDAAAYLGDAWRVGPQLQLVYGARIDQSRFLDAPSLNPAAESKFGIRTDHFPRETGVSPRIGFTYLPGAGASKPPVATIRGGVGLFRSGGSGIASVIASARNATGLPNAIATLSCVGAAVPAVDWSDFSGVATLPTECGGVAATGPTGPTVPPSVTLIDPALRVPQTLRASLGVQRTIHKSWNVSLEGSLTSGAHDVGMRDVNLLAAPRFVLSSEANRPVYAAAGSIVPGTGAIALAGSRVDPEFGVVALATSTLRSEDREITFSVGHNAPKLSLNLSGTHAWSREQQYGSIPAELDFNNTAPTAGDPRVARWVQNPWRSPNSIRAYASYSPRPWLSISPSLWAQNGYRFAPTVAGDVNGDGASNDLAFVFDPAHTADTAVANGMQRLLAAAPKRVRDCLGPQLGRMATPSSCSVPWYMSGALSVQVTPPWQNKRLTLSIQTNNLFGGADLLLHGASHLHGWGQFNGADRQLLYVRGFDPVTQQFKYAVNERFGVARQSQVSMLRPLQLLMQARLNLGHIGGPMMGGPMMGGPMVLGAGGGARPGVNGASALSADTLRARVARTLPNRYRRTLALNDSLALHLDTAQTARLKSLGDAFQAHADSVVGRVVAAMRAPLTTTTSSEVATRVRTETQAGHALEVQAVADLRSILTPDQLAKLPAELTRAP